MIAYLNGTLTLKTPTVVYMECNQVGYEVHISLNTFTKIQDEEQYKLYTYLHVKEDAHTLYGFADEDEKEMFVLLISVSGIGPSTGRMVLSSMTPKEIRTAILMEDEKRISTIKGIGPKSAKRLILELKDKVAKKMPEAAIISSTPHNTHQEEALSALATLGFNRSQAEKAITKAMKLTGEVSSVEELIKHALNNL